MPIIRNPGAQPYSPREDSLISRLKSGRVVPIFSSSALTDLTMGGHALLTQHLTEYMQYPLPNNDRVVHIARYYKIKRGLNNQDLKLQYLNIIKNFVYVMAGKQGVDSELLVDAEENIDELTVSEFAKILGYPHFDKDSTDPLLVLANLPIKIYLTTSPYTIIEEALAMAGKDPVTDFCRWQRSLDGIDEVITPNYRPSAERPLVYHLHGLDSYPDSLVLTEDDHLEFLVNICQGAGNNAADRVPGIIRQALVDDLILLGFSLSDWAFRSLYAGLIISNSRNDDRGVCVLQLVKSKIEEEYLEKYVEQDIKFDVYWGDVPDYGPELSRLLKLENSP